MATSYLSYQRPQFSSSLQRSTYSPQKYSSGYSLYQRPSTSYQKQSLYSSHYNHQQQQPSLSQAVKEFSRELDQIFLEKSKALSQYNTPPRPQSSKSFLNSTSTGYKRGLTPSTSHHNNVSAHYRTNSSLLSSQKLRSSYDYSDDLFETPPRSIHNKRDEYYSPTVSRFSATQSQSFYSPQKQPTFQPKQSRGVIPPNRTGKQYTLVLDLDETLTHTISSFGPRVNFLKRPGVEEFLNDMSQYFEIIIFTAALQEYADEIIDQIDPYNVISHRLYRQHLTVFRGEYIKDLSILGRDLSKTLIVDNLRSNFMAQPSNGYEIEEYRGQTYDNVLRSLARSLRNLVINKVDDIRLYPIRI